MARAIPWYRHRTQDQFTATRIWSFPINRSFPLLFSLSRTALATVLLWCCAAVHAEQYTVPLFATASPGSDPQGVLRLVSDAQTAGTVAIHAIDDAGARIGPITLELNPWTAVEFTASELQSGNTAKGLASGLGNLAGDVRLVIDSDVAIVPSAYVRSGDGALSTVHDTVIEARNAGTYRYDVAIFHPAANAPQQSRLRLINPGEGAARLMIAARDDTGATATGGTVELTLPGGGAQTLTAQQLEAGDPAVLTGRLGAGVGNWRLSVMSDRPIQAVSVTVGTGGDWSNLSTTAVTGWAPEDEVSFQARFLERVIVSRDGLNRLEQRVLAEGRIRATVRLADGGEVIEEGSYGFERTGRDAGLLTLRYDSGRPCTVSIFFDSPTSGWYASSCVDAADAVEDRGGGSWWALDAGAAPLDLGSGLDDMTYTVGTAIDVLTLPAPTGGGGGLTYSLSPEVPGLTFDAAARELSGTPTEAGAWLMTYRVRDASGDSDWRYFNIAVETATGGGETTHGVGDTLSDLPTGSWTPDVTIGGSFSSSAGNTTVDLNEGGYIEEGGHRYTCQSTGGCLIENRRVTSGTVVQTASGTAPGSGVSGDHGDDRASAAEVAAGSDTQGDLTAGDVDYFRVVVNTAGTLEAYTTGRTDTLGRLEDADGSELSRNDDGGAGTNFRISEDVSPGTYFVRVAGYSSRVTGDYTLHVRFTESSTGASPSFADGAGPGDQTYTVGTAISALTLPEARGGDGPLTYSLTPAVPGLSFNATASVRRLSGTPTAAGTYEMTFRVRDTDGDTDSLTFVITVENAGGSGGVAGDFGLDEDNGGPSGIAFANGRFFVVDTTDAKVYAYSASGERDAAADFELMGSASGIAFAEIDSGRFYIAHGGDVDYIYAYSASGEPDSTAGFDLHDDNSWPTGVTYADGRIYVLDSADNHVYAYSEGGEHDPAAGFPVRNGHIVGLSYAVGRFYVLENNRDHVYAYSASGEPDSAADFDLRYGNSLPNGMTYANGRFYVVDGWDDHVYVYSLTGEPLNDSAPDLDAVSPSASDTRPATDESFTLSVTVRNVGDAEAPATTVRFYVSTNFTNRARDTEVGTDRVSALPAGGRSSGSIRLTAPSSAGTYYYWACVDAVDDEFNTSHQCSSATIVTVEGPSSDAPDLVVQSPSVSDSTPSAGGSFTLSATVHNDGDGDAPATTLRYYRSSNATISRSDTQVGTDSVSGLSASRTSAESISLTAPSSAGTYYYGACVDSVTGESDTDNNCSSGVRVTVSSGETGGGGNGNCVEVNDVVEIGEGQSCTITQALVNKYSLNSFSVRAGDTASCSGGRVRLGLFNSSGSIHLNGLTIRCR